MGSVLKFRQNNVTRQTGELARLKVVQGPDYGSLFVVMGARTSIGRGDDNDVVVSDLKASRRHAELIALPGGGWQVRDTGSSNGIGYHGRELKQVTLNSNDHFSIGETVLEFVSSSQATQILIAPPKPALDLRREQQAFDEQRARVRSLARGKAMPKGPKAASANQEKSLLGKFALPLAAAAGLFLWLGDQQPSNSQKKRSGAKSTASVEKNPEAGRDPASMLTPPSLDNGESARSAEAFFKEGFREYREKNYLRAKIGFENVLQVNPGHRLARIYLENCDRSIDEEVSFHLTQGKKDINAGRLKAARGHFEAVMRLLTRDASNPKMSEAKDAIQQIDLELKGGTG